MTTEEMGRIEAEVKGGLTTAMIEFCKQGGITQGWSVAQHAKFELGEIMDVVESGDAVAADEAKFRIYVILRTLANYSAWRQLFERDGTPKTAHLPLAPSAGRGTKSLLGEYQSL